MADISYTPSIERLAQSFRTLPGVGKKSAYRMAFAVLDFSESDVAEFADALIGAKQNITVCSVCHNISETEICPVCRDSKRNKRQICVVEDPKDVAAIIGINDFEGVFHVLGGLISPLEGKTPENKQLIEIKKDYI